MDIFLEARHAKYAAISRPLGEKRRLAQTPGFLQPRHVLRPIPWLRGSCRRIYSIRRRGQSLFECAD